MDQFAMFAKVTAKAGQREALAEHLLEASHLLMSFAGCLLYIVNSSLSDPDAVCVFEAWRSEADHDASLNIESVKALIARTRPLVANFESQRLVPVGGKGLPPS
jgi:quinol monooxygenase YgiN